jgi:hypothetical protein
VTRALDVPVHEGLKIEADAATLAFRAADERKAWRLSSKSALLHSAMREGR